MPKHKITAYVINIIRIKRWGSLYRGGGGIFSTSIATKYATEYA